MFIVVVVFLNTSTSNTSILLPACKKALVYTLSVTNGFCFTCGETLIWENMQENVWNAVNSTEREGGRESVSHKKWELSLRSPQTETPKYFESCALHSPPPHLPIPFPTVSLVDCGGGGGGWRKG